MERAGRRVEIEMSREVRLSAPCRGHVAPIPMAPQYEGMAGRRGGSYMMRDSLSELGRHFREAGQLGGGAGSGVTPGPVAPSAGSMRVNKPSARVRIGRQV
jgi:hypothetical protein